MSKKTRRPQKQKNKKWSRANIMNYVAGGIVAVSMVLGSVVVFGGAQPSAAPTAVPTTVAAVTPTTSVQAAPTSTPAATPTSAPAAPATP